MVSSLRAWRMSLTGSSLQIPKRSYGRENGDLDQLLKGSFLIADGRYSLVTVHCDDLTNLFMEIQLKV
jgi:hypothetical protein